MNIGNAHWLESIAQETRLRILNYDLINTNNTYCFELSTSIISSEPIYFRTSRLLRIGNIPLPTATFFIKCGSVTDILHIRTIVSIFVQIWVLGLDFEDFDIEVNYFDLDLISPHSSEFDNWFTQYCVPFQSFRFIN